MGVSIMKIDLGDKCVHCKKDTSLGSGNFVNRYQVFDLDPFDTGDELTGYCCYECELEIEKEFS